MNVRRVELRGFTRHKETAIELPSRGVVLVTGDNGAGKSSLVEGVSWCLWGKTLRGAVPWQTGAVCGARVLTDQLDIQRERRGAKTDLLWARAGTDAALFESATKAQATLEGEVGTWDVWRRSHAFSSADASHFTLATDAERKRLLEAILGLDRFDPALDACRADVRLQETMVAQAESRVAVARAHLDAGRQRVLDAERALASVPSPEGIPELEQQVTALTTAVNQARAQVEGLERAARTRARQLGEIAGVSGGQAARAARLDRDTCPTCEQAIPQAVRQSVRQAAQGEQAKLEAQRAELNRCDTEADAELDRLRAELLGNQQMLSSKSTRLAALRQGAALRDQAERTRRQAELSLLDLSLKVSEAEKLVAESQGSGGVLAASAQVLGLKGVRVQVLARALAGLELVSNRWLARLAPGVTMRVRPYAEKKSGGVSDAIDIVIEGLGDGQGYRATSGGERRRLDVALLLALAEVASAAHAREPGTLFLDEVFDALDRHGIDAVIDVLTELSANRCVVVISHAPELIKRLNPAQHFHLTEGHVG
jgi:DNA repair exonuclease SbcCD ATPase subunit